MGLASHAVRFVEHSGCPRFEEFFLPSPVVVVVVVVNRIVLQQQQLATLELKKGLGPSV